MGPYSIKFISDVASVAVFLHFGERMLSETVPRQDENGVLNKKKLKSDLLHAVERLISRYHETVIQIQDINSVVEEVKKEKKIL